MPEEANDKSTEIVGSSQQANTSPDCRCLTAGVEKIEYVYSIGKIAPHFPSVGIEKEFAQVAKLVDTNGLTEQQAFQTVISQRSNYYLARKLNWVQSIKGIDTYILQMRHCAEFQMLIDSVRTSSNPTDLDLVIGTVAPQTSPIMINGAPLTPVQVDKIYSFNIDSITKSIPRPAKVSEKEFLPTAQELFWTMMQVTDNTGRLDQHRALNYVAVRYDEIYRKVLECHQKNCSLIAVDVRTSPLAGSRNILNVIFSFVNRNTDVKEKHYAQVDVTEEFPFLVAKLSPYYDR